jgi:transposase
MSRKRTYGSVDIKDVRVSELLPVLVAGVLVGIDVAKEKFVVAVATAAGVLVKLVRFAHPLQTRLFLQLLADLRVGGSSLHVLMEPTGTYGDALRQQIADAGHKVFMVQPKHTHDIKEIIDGVPSSHDGKSAVSMVRLHREGCSRAWRPLEEQRRTLRAHLTRLGTHANSASRHYGQLEAMLARHWPEFSCWLDVHRQYSALALLREFPSPALVSAEAIRAADVLRRVSRGALDHDKIVGVIDSAKSTLGMPMLSAESALLRELVAAIEGHERAAEAIEEEIVAVASPDATFTAMRNIVGVAAAAAVLAMLGPPANYPCPRAYLKAAGLNLRVFESGEKVGRLSITKRGPSLVRQLLYLASLRWIQSDPFARAWYESRATYGRDQRNAAVVALMRKLLTGVWAAVRKGESFDSTQLFDTRRLAAVENKKRRSEKRAQKKAEPRSAIRRARRLPQAAHERSVPA